jgi:methyl-accepting chemotaxis protein
MKKRIKLSAKMIILVLTTSALIYITAISFIAFSLKQNALNDAKKLADEYAKDNALKVESELNSEIAVSRTLSQAFKNYKKIPLEDRTKIYGDMYTNIIQNYPQFYAVWDSWEYSAIDPKWEKPYGRILNVHWRQGNQIKISQIEKSLNGDASLYAKIKRNAIESIEDPYLDSSISVEPVLMTSLVSPLIDDNKFIGCVGVDIRLDRFQSVIDSIKPFKNSYAFLVSNNGKIIAHPNKDYVNKDISKVYSNQNTEFKILDNIQHNKTLSFITEENNDKVYISYVPINVGKSISPWSLGIVVPVDAIMKDANKSFKYSLLVGIIGLIILAIVIFIISRTITNPIVKVTKLLKKVAAGDLSSTETIKIRSNDEIRGMVDSLGEMKQNLKDIIVEIRYNSNSLSTSSGELTKVSNDLVESFETMTNQANQVASATEEMSMNMNTIASTAEEMSVNISTVASAAEEMTNSMGNISETAEKLTKSMNNIGINSKESAKITGEAMGMASIATNSMNNLGMAANEIGEVTYVIKRIAEQTNLLALNATIEAASAGDAGKGFAVVANEIKELANQSAKAAEDITKKIHGVQLNTSEAIKIINKVSEIITMINKSEEVINKSVNEQSEAMGNITLNIEETNKGIKNIAKSVLELTVGAIELSKNAGEAANGTNDVAENILNVSLSVSKNSENANEVIKSANQLSVISKNLMKVVSIFNIGKEDKK